jgi:pSer/pThr/pTyr-binding forkhead associated (FHA) protein
MATSTIGRSSRNDVVIDDDEVSRSHALIQRQGPAEYWLVDLGSSNGTKLNGRVVVQPSRLVHGDLIRIGREDLVFLCDESPEPGNESGTLAGSTVRSFRVSRQGLLLADIEGFTPMSQRLKPSELAGIVGRWVSSCRQLVEAHGGSIHKYLGDGWFASWDADGAEDQMGACLQDLLELQKSAHPRFRFVVHVGEVTSSGSPAGQELGMLGPDVNLLFRMEKLAGKLDCPAMATSAGWATLENQLEGQSVGLHRVAGFEQEFECFSILGER